LIRSTAVVAPANVNRSSGAATPANVNYGI
jgi:hypothetical protein